MAFNRGFEDAKDGVAPNHLLDYSYTFFFKRVLPNFTPTTRLLYLLPS